MIASGRIYQKINLIPLAQYCIETRLARVSIGNVQLNRDRLTARSFDLFGHAFCLFDTASEHGDFDVSSSKLETHRTTKDT